MKLTIALSFAALALAVPTTGWSQSSPVTPGSYSGSYVCGQGRTNATLEVKADGTGVFRFGGGGQVAGAYTVRVTASGDTVSIAPDQWIQMPRGYVLVPAQVKIGAGGRLDGVMRSPSCSTITLALVSAAQGAEIVGPSLPMQTASTGKAPLPGAPDDFLVPQERARLAYNQPIAATPMVAADFTPPPNGSVDKVRDWVNARDSIDELTTKRCNLPVMRYNPGGEAERIATVKRCQVTPQTDEAIARLTSELTAWAAAQPATMEGLKTLNHLAIMYTYAWPQATTSPPGGVRAFTAVKQVLFGRRDAIVAQIRPTITVRINDRANDITTFDMFGADKQYEAAWDEYTVNRNRIGGMPPRPDGKAPFWQTAQMSWQSAREATAAPASWTAPTDQEVAYAMLRTFRSQGGKQLSPFSVSMPNVDTQLGLDLINQYAPISIKVHDVRVQACRREGAGFRCDYNPYTEVTITSQMARDAMWMLFYQQMNNTYGGKASGLFVPTAGGWKMPELEQAIQRGQGVQAQGIADYMGAAVNAGASAVNIMQNAVSPPRQPGSKSQMEEELDQRIKDADEKH